jgi:5-methylcytosine-specific restriction endonuclease McrA
MNKFDKNRQARKPKKVSCEICECQVKATLHWHHIIPRTDPKCTDDWKNVVVVCSNCHNKIHADIIKIFGIYDSTKLPYKRTVVFEENGKKNIDI